MSKLIANCKMKEPASTPASSRVTCHRSPAATALGCVSPDSSKASESIGSVKSGQLEGFDADATRYSIEPTRFAIMFALMMEHGSLTWNRLKV
jgi:hypothetical protein